MFYFSCKQVNTAGDTSCPASEQFIWNPRAPPGLLDPEKKKGSWEKELPLLTAPCIPILRAEVAEKRQTHLLQALIQRALLPCPVGVGCKGLSSNRGEHMRSDVWGTLQSLHPKVEPNLLENTSKYAAKGKKINLILGSFFSSASVFSEPKWQIAFGFSLFHFKEEENKSTNQQTNNKAKWTRH